MKKENYLRLFLISGLAVLIIFLLLPSQVLCQNNDNETLSNDDTEYEYEEVDDSEDYAEDEEPYVPVNDLEEMQKRINKINGDPTSKAAQVLGQVQSGDTSGVVSELSKQMGNDSSFSSPLYWFFMIFISIVGMGFFWSGKRNGDALFMISGAIMSIFPYFVTNMWVFALLSVALIVLPFYLRRF